MMRLISRRFIAYLPMARQRYHPLQSDKASQIGVRSWSYGSGNLVGLSNIARMALNRSPLAIIDGCHIRIVNVSFSGLSPSSAKQPVFIVKCTFQVLTFTQLVAK